MITFSFYFGCSLEHTDNLSLASQDSSMSTAQGQRLAEDVCYLGIDLKPPFIYFG